MIAETFAKQTTTIKRGHCSDTYTSKHMCGTPLRLLIWTQYHGITAAHRHQVNSILQKLLIYHGSQKHGKVHQKPNPVPSEKWEPYYAILALLVWERRRNAFEHLTCIFFKGLVSYCWFNPQPMRKDHSIAGTTILQRTPEDADITQFYW